MSIFESKELKEAKKDLIIFNAGKVFQLEVARHQFLTILSGISITLITFISNTSNIANNWAFLTSLVLNIIVFAMSSTVFLFQIHKSKKFLNEHIKEIPHMKAGQKSKIISPKYFEHWTAVILAIFILAISLYFLGLFIH